MKTIFVKPTDIQKKWYVVDAQDQVLGRLASKVAVILRGKGKPTYSPHWDTGDLVIVVNAGKIRVTGNKSTGKMYYRHSHYPGGFKAEPYGKVFARKPVWPLEKAIRGMLPKGPLGHKIIKHLKVYAGPTHPHGAQTPEKLEM